VALRAVLALIATFLVAVALVFTHQPASLTHVRPHIPWQPRRSFFFYQPPSADRLDLREIKSAAEEWARAARDRDVDRIVALYDEKAGRLLGTLDEATTKRRADSESIRAYFNHFLGGNDEVVPLFPKFDPNDVTFIDDKSAAYSGYYTFLLTKSGVTRTATAKFTFVYHKTHAGVRIMVHNSGLTPTGILEA
jgi:hypothetical protein